MTPILQTLKNKKQLIAAAITAAIFFAINYQVMKNLPGHRDFACVQGAGLNPLNISFSILMSFAVGLMVAGVMQLYSVQNFVASKPGFRRDSSTARKAGSVSLVAAVSGFFTVFCTACSLPFITLFGFSISLTFFTEYDIYIKIISTILMAASLYMLNKQLKGECRNCLE